MICFAIVARKRAGPLFAFVVASWLLSSAEARAVEVHYLHGAVQIALSPNKPGVFLHFDGGRPVSAVEDSGGRVWYESVYTAVDAVFYRSLDGPEYDIIVHPGGDPSRIRVSFRPVRGLTIGAHGELIVDGINGAMVHTRPIAYQDTADGRQFIACRYRRAGLQQIGFSVGSYDRRYTLVIDPVIKNSFNFGGTGVTRASRVAVDSGGFLYVTGITNAPDFPTSAPGTPLGTYSGVNANTEGALGEVFVRKIDPSTGAVLYSVLFGTGNEQIDSAIAVDAQGNAWVTGRTSSQSFPASLSDSYSSAAAASGSPVFVFELNSKGTAVLFSRLLGGSQYNNATAIAASPDGGVWITGSTASSDFPVTSDAFQKSSGGAFIVKLDAQGAVQYATCLGESGAAGSGIAVDTKGDVYVTGGASNPFPTTPNSFAPYAGEGGFATKFDHTTHKLIYSTYLPGASSGDFLVFSPLSIAADDQGNAYVSGCAAPYFPTTEGAFQTEPVLSYSTDAFALELDPAGANLVFSTRIGGSEYQCASGIALAGGSVAIIGVTTSLDFPANDHGLPDCGLASLQEILELGGSDWTGYSTFVANFDHSGHLFSSATCGNCNLDSPNGMAAAGSAVFIAGTRGTLEYAGFVDQIDLNSSSPVQIAEIADAASFYIGVLSPLEIVAIFGKGLGPKQAVVADASSGMYPFSLAGTSATFNGLPMPLMYVSDSQINAAVPAGANVYWPNEITVVSEYGPSPTYTNYAWPAAPSIFTVDMSGTGQGVILNEDGTLNSPENPAARGSTVTVFGRGGGLLANALNDGQVATQLDPLQGPPTALIGGEPSVVSYAGAPQGMIAGAMQVKVVIPDDITPASTVSIQLESYQFVSQPEMTIAVK